MTAPIQVSGGNYPLIQQPSPFEELAQTIQGIQAQHQARLLQNLQRQQLLAGIQHLAAQTQQEQAQTAYVQGQTANQPTERARLQADTGRALAESDLANTRNRTEQQKTKDEENTRLATQMGLGPINAALAQGVDPNSWRFSRVVSKALGQVTDEAARHNILEQYQQVRTNAQAQATSDRATEADRLQRQFIAQHPRLAGATAAQMQYMAAEDRIAAEKAKLGAGQGAMQQRMSLGAGSLAQVIQKLEENETRPGATQRPILGEFGQAILRTLPRGAGNELAERVRMGAASTPQQREDVLGNQFVNALGSLYGARGIPAPLAALLRSSYLPQAGETPENRSLKRQDRRDLLGVIAQVRAGTMSIDDLTRHIADRAHLPPEAILQLNNSAAGSMPGSAVGHPADAVDPNEFLNPVP